jgi:shikimate kinase
MYQRIEFMGLAGAGKSTLANGFLENLRRKKPSALTFAEAVTFSIKQRDDGLLRNLAKKFPSPVWEPLCGSRNALSELHLFSSENAALLSLVFSTLTKEEMSQSARQCIVYTFFQLFAKHQLLVQYQGNENLIFAEEGFGQAGSMLFGYLPSGNALPCEVEQYVTMAPKGRALVWVDTPVEQCLQRLQLREELPIVLQKERIEDVTICLHQARSCFHLIYSQSLKLGLQAYRIENHDNGLSGAVSNLQQIADEVLVEI